jgi:membrane protease YdiL (CAAX protease family)
MTTAPPKPPPGWYPDPYRSAGSPGVRFWDGRQWTQHVAEAPGGAGWTSDPPPLDRKMAELRAEDRRPWGWQPAVLPLMAGVLAVGLGTTANHLYRPHTFTAAFTATVVLNAVMYTLLGGAVWYAGRDIAARYGGWGRTFGLRRPVLRDLGYIGSGIGVAFIGRLVVGVLANGLSHGRAGEQSRNLHLHTSSIPVDILLVALVVVLAPVVEEIIFRGLLLRSFLWRMPFWPAALLSTFVFAAFHTYEVNTLVGAVTLAGVVATLGLTNCYLVRLTDRLAPGMVVHAAFNGLAVGILIYQAH